MVIAYFRSLIEWFGSAWNRFWYTPADPLPLGWMRLLIGTIAIVSLVSYSPDIDHFLSSTGMLPVETVVELQTARLDNGGEVRPWRWSYFDYLAPSEVQLAHILGITVLVAYTLGIFTRYTSIAALVVVLSYLHRTPAVTFYHERFLAFVMFYLALGPSGATLSVDRWLANRKGQPAAAPSWGANVSLRLMQIHLCLAVFMMAISKLSRESSWWNGMAIWWLSSIPDGPLVDLSWVRNHRFVINFWTHAIAFLELGFPFLVWNKHLRPLIVVLAFMVWTSVMVVTGYTLFILALLTSVFCFVSGEQLRAIAATVGLSKSPDKLPVS